MTISVETALGTVVAEELYDSFGKGIGQEQGPFIRKKYWVPGDKADAFANALVMGLNTITGRAATSFITIFRVTPHQCPESPNLNCVNVNIEEFDGVPTIDGGRVVWPKAVVAADYGPLRYNLGQGQGEGGNSIDPSNNFTPDGQEMPFCTVKINEDSEIIGIPETAYKFYAPGVTAIDGKKIGYPVQKHVGIYELTVTCHKVPFLPRKIISLCKGKLNLKPFMGEETGTVLYKGADISIDPQPDGSLAAEVVHKFKQRSIPWNCRIAPDGQWYPVTSDGTATGSTVYDYIDLKPLIFGVSLSDTQVADLILEEEKALATLTYQGET